MITLKYPNLALWGLLGQTNKLLINVKIQDQSYAHFATH